MTLWAAPVAALECLEGHPHYDYLDFLITSYHELDADVTEQLCDWENQDENQVFETLYGYGLETGQILRLRPNETLIGLLARDPNGRELRRLFEARGLCPLSAEELTAIKQNIQIIDETSGYMDFRDLGRAAQARGHTVQMNASDRIQEGVWIRTLAITTLEHAEQYREWISPPPVAFPDETPKGPWPFDVRCGAGLS